MFVLYIVNFQKKNGCVWIVFGLCVCCLCPHITHLNRGKYTTNTLCLIYTIDIHTTHIFNEKSSNFKDGKCSQPWKYFCFNSKGDISLCCHLEHSNKNGNVFKDYNFNSSEMSGWRKKIMSDEIPDDCLYCQRRFQDDPQFAEPIENAINAIWAKVYSELSNS